MPNVNLNQCLFLLVGFAKINLYVYFTMNIEVDMKDKLKYFLIGINVICVVLFIASVVIPVERKNTDISSTEIKQYDSKGSIPKIGAITNDRSAKITFEMYDQKLCGIGLYFNVTGTDDNGKIMYKLEHEDEIVSEGEVSVKALMAADNRRNISETELNVGNISTFGKYTLTLEGKDISEKTRVSLYGSRDSDHLLKYENANYDEYIEIIYSLKILTPQHPFIWMTSMLLAFSILFSSIIYIGSKEKKVRV